MRPRHHESRLRAAGLGLVGFALAGCSAVQALDGRQNAGPCPSSVVLYEASRVVEFAEPGSTLFSNISYTAEITNVQLYCRYVGTEPIVAEVEIDLAFGKGPQATSQTKTFPYFVAVTRTNRSVLEREVFTAEARFDAGESVTAQQELIGRLEIPRYDESISGANFEVIVGFELTPEQLEFNRSGQRYRIDAATGLLE